MKFSRLFLTLSSFFLLTATISGAQTYSVVVNGAADNCGPTPSCLSVSPSGGTSFTWYSAIAYPGGPSLSTGPICCPSTSGHYLCVVTGPGGTFTTTPVRVRSLNPYVTTNGGTVLCSGSSVMLQEQVSYLYAGSTMFPATIFDSYQWFLNGNPIPGATSWNYNATSGGTYTLRVGISCGTAFSNPVTVTFQSPLPAGISIASGGPLTFCQGGSVSLSVPSIASTYQWRRNGAIISGATSPVLVAATSGNYTCTLSNICGSQTTPSVSVSVITNPSATITASGSLTFCSGGSVQLNASIGAGYTYSWKKDGITISGAVANSYTASATGVYSVDVSAAGCTTTSAGVTVSVVPAPVPTIIGLASSYVCQSPNVLLSGTPTGGTFSGPGITGNQFSPSALSVGGPYAITYTVTNSSGCSGIITQNTSVVSGFNCLTPQSLVLTGLTGTTASLRWTQSSSSQYQVRYRRIGTTNYTVKTFTTSACQNTYTLSGLKRNTSYEISLRSFCSSTTASGYSNVITFVTPSARIGDREESVWSLYPNPAGAEVYISVPEEYEANNIHLSVTDMAGRIVLQRNLEIANGEVSFPAGDLTSGLYLVTIFLADIAESVPLKLLVK